MIYEESDLAVLFVGHGRTRRGGADELAEKGYSCSLVNARFVKPLDTEMLEKLSVKHRYVMILEENIEDRRIWGAGAGVRCRTRTSDESTSCRIPDQFVEHGDIGSLPMT